MDPDSTAFRQGRTATTAPIATAMAHIWTVTSDNTRATQIAAGRDWLGSTSPAWRKGWGSIPLSQALQEYPEMAEVYDTVHARFAPAGGTVQMLCRLGYGPEIGPTPRWPVEAKILDA
jgi:hypothetical protein